MLKGALGKDLCPSSPPKFNLVGVVGAEAWVIGIDTVCDGADTGARGVVGVVPSLFNVSPMLTD